MPGRAQARTQPQKKGGSLKIRPFSLNWLGLDSYDVLGLRAFLALRDSELDFLAFGQRLEAIARDVAEMSKYVWA